MRALVCCALLTAGCQVRGLVGSNESAADGESSAAGGGGSGETGADTRTTNSGGGTGGSSAGAGSGLTAGQDDGSSSGDAQSRLDLPEGENSETCAPPTFASCDAGEPSDLRWQHVIGLCGQDQKAEFEKTTRDGALAIVKGRIGGPKSPFSPREGERMLVLSTGDASELAMTPDQLRARHPLDCEDPTYCPSTDLGGSRIETLPKPLDWEPVHAYRDCADEPHLVGQGDCSNSLQEPWQSGDGAFDYGELRMEAEVPRFTDAIEFDFAFFSSEYPLYTDGGAMPFNDMFVAWLESEAWTGNVSFDDSLRPITAQSVFMDYRSASDSCPDCYAPELEGFSMEHHGGTRWLTTKAPVVPGETIELVFAIFDLSDPSLDSMVLLDGFKWSCSGSRPITTEG